MNSKLVGCFLIAAQVAEQMPEYLFFNSRSMPATPLSRRLQAVRRPRKIKVCRLNKYSYLVLALAQGYHHTPVSVLTFKAHNTNRITDDPSSSCGIRRSSKRAATAWEGRDAGSTGAMDDKNTPARKERISRPAPGTAMIYVL